jgi:sugar phosphate isomerase/epimerase
MKVLYCCPFWGSELLSVNDFLEKVIEHKYQGIEINIPETFGTTSLLLEKISQIRNEFNPEFQLIAQQVVSSKKETAKEYSHRMLQRLDAIAESQPNFINAHTGKDYYSYDENCAIIDTAENWSINNNIPIYHEIHRGRFTFHPRTLLPYLKEFPNIKLTADFSHWCTVSESMLEEQEELFPLVFPHIHHIHARIGHQHAPQVNDPFAPEWKYHLEIFTQWWQNTIAVQKKAKTTFTITPEFGPEPYMPTMPYTLEPLCNQWETNVKMKNYLQSKITI